MCGAGWAEKAIISAVYIRTVSLLTFQEVLTRKHAEEIISASLS